MTVKEITDHLVNLEKERNIKILMAIESGSRAWGFPSPDSDYDVRIVYVHTKDWYLSINERKDNIDYFHGELLDINGWDIRKTLSLLKKSNATPFEWAQSPIVYQEEPGFRNQLLVLAKQYFQPYHTINHYTGIAKNSYLKSASAGEINLKKLFYVIRPVFAINWILETKSLPPMDIFSLMEMVKDEAVKAKIHELIARKETVGESYVYTLDAVMKTYIESQFERLDQTAFSKPKETPPVSVLNEFYRDLLNKYDR